MMPLTTAQLEHTRAHLGEFQLRKLFLEDLGWMAYRNPSSDLTLKDGTAFVLDPVAQASGVVVLEVRAKEGTLPDKKQRESIHNAVAKKHHENLLIFTDRNAKGDVTSSIWSWAKKEGTKRIPRELYYLRGQSGDLLLSKLHGMFIDMAELDDEGRIPVPEVTRRLAESFDIERVTKKFFGEFQSLHGDFVELIEGIDDPADRKWYASVLLNRLMFVYFMQKKGFVDANPDYLWTQFKESQKVDGKDKFYSIFLDLLFFEGFAKDESKRSAAAKKRLGKIKYLNGGLFLHHPLEIKYKGRIRIPDQAFANLLSADDPKGLFERFTWALDDRPGGDDRTINPNVLGYIFEKYINQKAFGAYYTRPEITDYLCERTISQLVLARLNARLSEGGAGVSPAIQKASRRLPHWYHDGATYFVTFRLADSMPQHLLDQWKREQEQWLRENPEPHTEAQANEFRDVFTEKRQAWLDAGHGSCALRDPAISEMVANALAHFDNDRYDLGDFVVMPNHVHLLVTPRNGHELSDILHSWKSFTAKEINKRLGRTGAFWQDESYDHLVRSEAQLEHYQRYITENPAKARLKREEYKVGKGGAGVPPAIMTPEAGKMPAPRFQTLNDALVSMDKKVVRALLLDGSEDGTKGILQDLAILDPACGSGAFVLAAMKRLFEIHVALAEKIKYLHDPDLDALDRELSSHASREYGIKKRLITDNLYGVDIMDEAVEICRLRLFLALVSSVHKPEHLEPLPNIDFNIFSGNSLIGVLRFPSTDDARSNMFGAAKLESLRSAAKEIADLVDTVRHPANNLDPEQLRDAAQDQRRKWNAKLNEMLLSDFRDELGIQFEQEQPKGKPTKRELTPDDIQRLKPFHWCLDFYRVMERQSGKESGAGVPPANEAGKMPAPPSGFDIIITNPPWEVVQAEEKEFLATVVEGPMREDARVKATLKKHGIDVIQKKTIDIKDWGKLRDDLLRIPEVEKRWLDFCSDIPHQVAWYKNAPQYVNQKSVVDGKNMTRKINLYAVFTEQCYNLLRDGGLCGIVIPSGIYTDLGTMQLREMLFSKTEVTGLFGFENRKPVFEGVDSRFKFVVLTFEKGGKGGAGFQPANAGGTPAPRWMTTEFPAVFMRHDVGELAGFPQATGFTLSTKLIKSLSPNTLAIPEFHSSVDVAIAEKAAKFPTLGAVVPGRWQLQLKQELNMTQDSDIFHDRPAKGRLPLVEGKMFHQFVYPYAEGRYWIDEKAARERILGRTEDMGQRLVYQTFRYANRRIARNTDERTLIVNVLPPWCLCPDTAQTVKEALRGTTSLYLAGVMNSFTVDFLIRQRVTAHVDAHFLYQTSVPRLTDGDKWFSGIVERAARLICTTPEYEDLWDEVMTAKGGAGVPPATNAGKMPAPPSFAERARLRAELDGIVAHLYNLTEDEFVHILRTFPLVKDEVKLAALNAYRDLERGVIKA